MNKDKVKEIEGEIEAALALFNAHTRPKHTLSGILRFERELRTVTELVPKLGLLGVSIKEKETSEHTGNCEMFVSLYRDLWPLENDYRTLDLTVSEDLLKEATKAFDNVYARQERKLSK